MPLDKPTASLLTCHLANCVTGNATEAPICTSNSDCDFSQGVCEKGKCRCNDGYQPDYDWSYAFCRKGELLPHIYSE